MTTPTQSLRLRLDRLAAWYGRAVRVLDAAQPLAAVLARGYVAQVFFLSGLTKLRDWDITLALFEDEYKVPLLSPAWAAAMGAGGELVLPVLLVLGLAGRFASLGLFVVNAVAVISLMEIAPAALQQHMLWGTLLAALAIYGGGKWAMDHWLAQHWAKLSARLNGTHNTQA